MDGLFGDAENQRSLLHAQAAEKPQLNYSRLALIEPGKLG